MQYLRDERAPGRAVSQAEVPARRGAGHWEVSCAPGLVKRRTPQWASVSVWFRFEVIPETAPSLKQNTLAFEDYPKGGCLNSSLNGLAPPCRRWLKEHEMGRLSKMVGFLRTFWRFPQTRAHAQIQTLAIFLTLSGHLFLRGGTRS